MGRPMSEATKAKIRAKKLEQGSVEWCNLKFWHKEFIPQWEGNK